MVVELQHAMIADLTMVGPLVEEKDQCKIGV